MATLLPLSGVYAQDSVRTMATSMLVERTEELIKADKPEELVQCLQELLVRVEGNTDDESLQTRSFCLYQIGICRMKLRQYAEARQSFETFLDEFPQDSLAPRAALFMAECSAMSGDWSAAETYARSLMEETSMDPQRRLAARQLLAEALYNQEKWQEATDILKGILDLAEDEKARNNATVMLLTAYAKGNDTDRFMTFLQTCSKAVLQDPRVNIALIEAADQKRQEGDFATALMLYRSVLLKEDLITSYEGQLKKLEATLAQQYKPIIGSSRSAYEEQQAKALTEYENKKQALERIRSNTGYDTDILFRIGQCFTGMKRNVPAYTLFRYIYTEMPDHALAEDSRFQAFVITLDMQKWDVAVQEATAYLDQYPQGRFTDEVSLNLMQVFLQTGRIDEAQAAGLRALELSPAHRFIDQVKYLLGYIHFQKMEYDKALALFEEVFGGWPEGMYHEASDYWIAMCRLFLGQFDRAITSFENYLSNESYPEKRFDEDASYRLGVALYGAGRFKDAEQTFLQFINAWPGSDLLSEAYSMMGDLRGADGDLDLALMFYTRAEEHAVNIVQINYAVFQSAAVYELQKKYDRIITIMEEYLLAHGEKGNYAGAGFWIGKAYTALGQEEKALETYIDTIVRFGDKPENDEIDLILRELVKQHQSREGWKNEEEIKSRLTRELAAAQRGNKRTLTLRLKTLFAYITEGTERQQYVDAILSQADVNSASALTLLFMATEAAERGDAEQVHEIYRHCIETYAESDILVEVMNTELRMLFKEGQYQRVLEMAEEITNRFGYPAAVGLTRKLKADAYRLLGQYDDAIKTYQELFAIREWRGPLTPEALYWIGTCTYEQGNPQEAFAFFQRVYVLYGSYPDWVAKAYEGSILCLEKMGRTEDIIRTCREMLANEQIAATPEGQRARERLARLLPKGGGQ